MVPSSPPKRPRMASSNRLPFAKAINYRLNAVSCTSSSTKSSFLTHHPMLSALQRIRSLSTPRGPLLRLRLLHLLYTIFRLHQTNLSLSSAKKFRSQLSLYNSHSPSISSSPQYAERHSFHSPALPSLFLPSLPPRAPSPLQP